MTEVKFVNAVLAASKIDEFQGKVFSIGPFGVRVGFSYQQERALNLVYALVSDKRVVPSHKILIAGGGLAGITAKVALHAMGIGDVWLFEERDDVLKMQHDAHHRIVHPCYNSWPLEDYFSPTSNLPFLNWYASSAAHVVSFLRTRWSDLYSRTLSRVRDGYKLTKLELTPEVNGTKSRLVAHLEHKHSGAETQEFDIAILATGFGQERDLQSSEVKSYWTPDAINTIRENEQDSRRIFVSGIGDGGLMDFTRLGFRDVQNSDLAIETISRLRHSKYSHPRSSLDDDAHECSPVEKRIREIERRALDLLPQVAEPKERFGSIVENQIASYLSEQYRSVIDMLPDAAEQFLEKQLHDIVNSGRLFLVGKLVAPFTCATAPINKLLVSFLLKRKPELYEQGFIDVPTKTLVMKTRARVPLDSEVIILRHGGQPPVFKLSPKFEQQNGSLNRAMADLVNVGRPDSSIYTDLRDIVSADPHSRISVDYRTKLAVALGKRTGISFSARCNRRNQANPFWFEFYLQHNDSLIEISRRLGGVPHDIFGIKLLMKDLPDAERLEPSNDLPGLKGFHRAIGDLRACGPHC